MPRAEKVDRVAELSARIEGSDALLLAEYRGLTVSEITTLRRSLSETGTRFAVVKNTLMRRAAAAADVADLEPLLEGPTAVAFVAGDPVAVAKRVVDAAKRFPSLVLKGGLMEGRVLSADEARSLAELESREVMLSRLAGLLKAELSRAASAFASAQATFLSLLEAYREKLPAEAETETQTEAENEATAATQTESQPETQTETQAETQTEPEAETKAETEEE